MLNDILFLVMIFTTRIVLPIIITGAVSLLLERALRHDANGTT